MKNIICLLFFTIFVATVSVSAQKYQINDINYNLEGRTREYALNKALDIRKDITFESLEQLKFYIDFLSQKLNDQRVLENSSITYEFGTVSENGITPVNLTIYAEETWNILPLPYPKYNSNSGFSLKVKVKDYNFLGTMEPFDFDFEFYQEDEGTTNAFGLGVGFSIPFAIGIFDSKWANKAKITYTIGESKPEFSFSTGLNVSYAFKYVTLQLEAEQSVDMDKDYRDVGDEIYATEFLKFSTPITLLRTTGPLANITLTPYTSISYSWDLDGVQHKDLVGPSLGLGYSFSTGKVNWVGNFRKGFLASFSNSYDYNLHDSQWKTGLSIQFEGFTFFKSIGFSTRTKFFTHYDAVKKKHTDKTNVATWLRGVYDDESYNSGRAELPAGFVINFDFPIRVVQTDWRSWGKTIFKRDMPSWFGLFDFELQVAPFIDIALYGADDYCLVHLDDGFYAAGLEFIVYPTKMRSIQVRASAGMDLSARLLEQDWRSKRGLEIEFGIGLHY